MGLVATNHQQYQGEGMPSIKDLPCWEIMECDPEASCAARDNPELDCWTLARNARDYRVEFDVCRDCIVYMVKNDKLVISAGEISSVRRELGHQVCRLAS